MGKGGEVGHDAIVNKQQNVACQHDLSLNPMRHAVGTLPRPKGGLEIDGSQGVLLKWRKGGLFAHPVHFVYQSRL